MVDLKKSIPLSRFLILTYLFTTTIIGLVTYTLLEDHFVKYQKNEIKRFGEFSFSQFRDAQYASDQLLKNIIEGNLPTTYPNTLSELEKYGEDTWKDFNKDKFIDGIFIANNHGHIAYHSHARDFLPYQNWTDDKIGKLIKKENHYCIDFVSCGYYFSSPIMLDNDGSEYYLVGIRHYDEILKSLTNIGSEFSMIVQVNHKEMLLFNSTHLPDHLEKHFERWAVYAKEINLNGHAYFSENEQHYAVYAEPIDFKNNIYFSTTVNITEIITKTENLKLIVIFIMSSTFFIASIFMVMMISFMSNLTKKLTGALQYVAENDNKLLSEIDKIGLSCFKEIDSFQKNIILHHEKISLSKLKLNQQLQDNQIKSAEDYMSRRTNEVTGLPNKIRFKETVESGIIPIGSTLVLLDFKDFNKINDAIGHSAANHYIKIIGSKLITSNIFHSLYSIDIDRFAAITQENVKKINHQPQAINQVRELFKLAIKVEGVTFKCAFNYGAVKMNINHINNSEQPLLEASYALELAKKITTSDYFFYNETLKAQRFAENFVYTEFYSALKNNQFTIYLQPKVNSISGEIIGAESLIRWQHPDKGLMSPNQFIPALEGSVRIIDLTYWVIERSCKLISRLKDHNLQIPISINIPPAILSTSRFRLRLLEILKKNSIRPQLIELEITEEGAVNADSEINVLRELIEDGFSIAMDDFGTGYS